ncbi:MAG: hypothetical protein ABI577_02420 [bacterium]
MTNQQWEMALLQEVPFDALFPPTPELHASVLSGIARTSPSPNARWRYALAAAALVLGIAFATLLSSRQARDAVASFLGLAVDGERIEIAPTPLPGQTPPALPSALTPPQLGERASRDEAALLAGFQMILPGSLGAPAGYYAIFEDRNITIADYGAIQIWEFPLNSALVGKMVSVTGGTIVRAQVVNGQDGYWVSGGERLVTVENASGTPIAATRRSTTSNALIWADRGLYLRIEGAGSIEDALRIAAEMR